MTRKLLTTVVFIATSVVFAAGCGMLEPGTEGSAEANCASEFRFGNAEPLGSHGRFADLANGAAKDGVSTTLRNIADRAGWQDGWDRLVEVPQDITAAELDRRTGAVGVCWKNLPKRSSAEGPDRGYYLFLDGSKPIQVTSWYGKTDRAFDFQGRDQILADAPLIGTGTGSLRPE